MKIAGVKTGQNKGDPIELTPQKKIEEAVKMAVPEMKDFGDEFLLWPSDIVVTKQSFAQNGDLLRGMWANNRYTAEGKVKINLRHKATDTMRSPKIVNFGIKFEDTLDGMGMPDLKLVEFQVE